jgi:predicted Ser/Thr protein kinase
MRGDVIKELLLAAIDAGVSPDCFDPEASPDLPDDVRPLYAGASPHERQAVRRLLRAHRRAEGLLTDAGSQLPSPSADPCAGDRGQVEPMPEIPGFVLEQEIGRGGFGVVYKARQAQVEGRVVAVKVLRTDAGGAESVRRFRAEVRVLGRMDHPGIAKVVDAGVLPGGRPYLVMELVRGCPLMSFAASESLGLRERVALMRDVCLAVHHAHQRGVIHRDLKPTNIVVERADGTIRPRVIDFGIAKLLDDSGDEAATLQGARLGTPRYMSPEQAAGIQLNDVRVDVYALGVILCELLTGHLPAQLTAAGDRSGPPTAPSRLGQRAVASQMPESRHAPAAGFVAVEAAALRGDLDCIVLRAVEPRLEDRYGSAQALAEDLDRFLGGQPVHAARQGLVYLAGKFIRRQPALSAAVLLALLSVLAGSGAAMVGLARANAARGQSEEVTAFLLGQMLDPANPNLGRGEQYNAALHLREASSQAVARFGDQPVLLVRVLDRIAAAQRAMGAFSGAATSFASAAEAAGAAFGADDRRTLNFRLEAMLARLSSGETAGAVEECQQVLSRLEATVGRTDRLTLRARMHAAHLLPGRDVLAELEAVASELSRLGLEFSEENLELQPLLSRALVSLGRDAIPPAERAVMLAERLMGPGHSRWLEARLALAEAYRRANSPDRATQELAAVRDTASRLHGAGGFYTRYALRELVRIAREQQDWPAAVAAGRQQLAAAEAFESTPGRLAAEAAYALGQYQLLAGAAEDAATTLQRATELSTGVHGATHNFTVGMRVSLAQALVASGRAQESRVPLEGLTERLKRGTVLRAQAVICLAEADMAGGDRASAVKRIRAELADFVDAEKTIGRQEPGELALRAWLQKHSP